MPSDPTPPGTGRRSFGGDVVERDPTVNETVGCAVASCVEAGLGCSRVETRDQPSVCAVGSWLVIGCDGCQVYVGDVRRTRHRRIQFDGASPLVSTTMCPRVDASGVPRTRNCFVNSSIALTLGFRLFEIRTGDVGRSTI